MREKTTSKSHHAVKAGTDSEMLNRLFKETFQYFIKRVDPVTGLMADCSKRGSPSSIGVVGMGLSVYIAAVENNLISRKKAMVEILKVLRFIYFSKQSQDPDASGYRGFYYHFLDMKTGKRVWKCELSTIDTAFFIAGALSVSCYFNGGSKEETEIRQLADDLYRRVDWHWALAGTENISHGWKPETGFLQSAWNDKYSEAMILYMLAMGSPTYPIPVKGYKKWTQTFDIKKRYGIEYIYAGPLFIHQFSHMWIDFRGIKDDLTGKLGFDYFENSQRATYMHREYAIRNPKHFNRYSSCLWGLSASNGPGDQTIKVKRRTLQFFGYCARGAPYGPDDGTVSPWSVVASLPFAPEIVMESMRHSIEKFGLQKSGLYGLQGSFNPTYPDKSANPDGWISPYWYGLNQAAIILMIENYRTGRIWEIMKRCLYLGRGLKKAGFTRSKN
jgi:hypothetical protein